MKKPINISYEVVCYLVATMGVIYVYRHVFENQGAEGARLFEYQIFAYYFILIFVISLRTFLKKQIDRLPISLFIFGFCCGYYVWGLFGWYEVSFNRKSIWDWLLFLLFATPGGIVGGLVAIPIGYAFYGLLTLAGLVVKRAKKEEIK